MVACISVIALIVTTYNFYGKGTEYFATIDPLEAKISIRGRGNFSSLEKKDIIESIEERLLEIDELKSIYLKLVLIGLTLEAIRLEVASLRLFLHQREKLADLKLLV